MSVHSFFDDTVAAGWQPVDPCSDEQELARMDSCYVGHGDCMAGIFQIGDILYFDRSARATHTDCVVFRLSQRAIDALNDGPSKAPDGGPWTVNSGLWVKLVYAADGAPPCNLLLANGGDVVTASFFASEVPTDDPPIWPIRQVRRNGKLLFEDLPSAGNLLTRRALLAGGVVAPLALAACRVGDVEVPELPPVTESAVGDTAQVGANAATGTGSLAVAGPNTYNAGTLPGSPNYYGSFTGAAIDAASVVGATLTFDCVQTVSGSYAQVYMEANWGAGTQDSDIVQINPIGVGQRYVIQKFFSAIPAATGWSIKIRLNCSSSASFTMSNTLMQVETVKR